MNENFDEFLIDAKLHIDTVGRDDKYSDTYRYPYEPTAYAVLERIAESGYITKDDLLIDYGSGKGRVPVRRHIVGGANCTLISVETPLRSCRIGTCRRLSAGLPQIVVALFERQLALLLK